MVHLLPKTECLNEHLFDSLGDARRIIEAWANRLQPPPASHRAWQTYSAALIRSPPQISARLARASRWLCSPGFDLKPINDNKDEQTLRMIFPAHEAESLKPDGATIPAHVAQTGEQLRKAGTDDKRYLLP